jgi:hypothetical protein
MTIKYGACALHAGKLRPQAHTYSIQCLLLAHGNNSYTNAPRIYIHTYVVSLVSCLLKVDFSVFLTKIGIYLRRISKSLFMIYTFCTLSVCSHMMTLKPSNVVLMIFFIS